MQTEFIRKCPICGSDIIYKNKNIYSRRFEFKKAEKNNYPCKTCQSKLNYKNSNISQKISKSLKIRWKNKEFRNEMIKKNPMYTTDKKRDKNPMFGKNIYDIWVKKYGVEMANIKHNKLKQIRSINATGNKNSMFGRPTPQGAGNGWSGWYKKWYFRSLRELSYMINVIEKNNYIWQSAEKKNLTIEYINYDGKRRTYRADFLVENRWLVEVKPLKLFNTPLVKIKEQKAKEFCKYKNLEYVLVDPPMLTKKDILNLYNTNQIHFMGIYDKKFKEYYLGIKND